MTQQEAYQQLRQLIEQIEGLRKEANALAKEHKLVLEVLDRDGTLSTLNPDWMQDTYRLKKDLPIEALIFFHEDYCGCKAGFENCPEKDYIAERYAGGDIDECWVPSQFC